MATEAARNRSPRTSIRRTAIEVGSILFLFYANLLMGEFTASNRPGKTFAFALKDIFTLENIVIAVVAAFLGHLIFESLRRRL